MISKILELTGLNKILLIGALIIIALIGVKFYAMQSSITELKAEKADLIEEKTRLMIINEENARLIQNIKTDQETKEKLTRDLRIQIGRDREAINDLQDALDEFYKKNPEANKNPAPKVLIETIKNIDKQRKGQK